MTISAVFTKSLFILLLVFNVSAKEEVTKLDFLIIDDWCNQLLIKDHDCTNTILDCLFDSSYGIEECKMEYLNDNKMYYPEDYYVV